MYVNVNMAGKRQIPGWRFETAGYSGPDITAHGLRFAFERRSTPEQDRPTGHLPTILNLRKLANSEIWADLETDGDKWSRKTYGLYSGTYFVYTFWWDDGTLRPLSWKTFRVEENEGLGKTVVIHLEKKFFSGLKISSIELK